jgi:hypothetical protein
VNFISLVFALPHLLLHVNSHPLLKDSDDHLCNECSPVELHGKKDDAVECINPGVDVELFPSLRVVQVEQAEPSKASEVVHTCPYPYDKHRNVADCRWFFGWHRAEDFGQRNKDICYCLLPGKGHAEVAVVGGEHAEHSRTCRDVVNQHFVEVRSIWGL